MMTLEKWIGQMHEDRKTSEYYTFMAEALGESIKLSENAIEVSEKEAVDFRQKQWELSRQYNEYISADGARPDIKVELKKDHTQKMDEYYKKREELPGDVFKYDGKYYIQNW